MDQHRNIALDGLRGIAILLVVIHHGLPDITMSTRAAEWIKKLLHGGWIGVDLFFVLSGYLITSILIREKQTSQQFFRNFYARRVLRIWPPYLLCICLILGWTWAVNPNGLLFRQQLYLWFHAVNIGMYIIPEAFQGNVLGVSHMWSLAVEEHFYLLWPVLVYRLSTARLLQVAYVLVCLALCLRLVGVSMGQPPFYFVQTFCRLDALSCGGILAILRTQGVLHSLNGAARVVAVISAAMGLIFLVVKKGFWAWDPIMFSFGLTVVYVFFAAMFIMVLNGAAAELLSNKMLRSFGKFSYGWYLLDGMLRPFIDASMAKIGLGEAALSPELWSLTALMVRAMVPLALAWIMFTAIESPFLRLKSRFAG